METLDIFESIVVFLYLSIVPWIAIIPAMIAKSKGRSFALWYIYSILLFFIALIHSLLIKSSSRHLEKIQLSANGKKCPFCAEIIKQEAVICRYCGKEFSVVENSFIVRSGKE